MFNDNDEVLVLEFDFQNWYPSFWICCQYYGWCFHIKAMEQIEVSRKSIWIVFDDTFFECKILLSLKFVWTRHCFWIFSTHSRKFFSGVELKLYTHTSARWLTDAFFQFIFWHFWDFPLCPRQHVGPMFVVRSTLKIWWSGSGILVIAWSYLDRVVFLCLISCDIFHVCSILIVYVQWWSDYPEVNICNISNGTWRRDDKTIVWKPINLYEWYSPVYGPVHGPVDGPVHSLVHGPVHGPVHGSVHGPVHGPL